MDLTNNLPYAIRCKLHIKEDVHLSIDDVIKDNFKHAYDAEVKLLQEKLICEGSPPLPILSDDSTSHNDGGGVLPQRYSERLNILLSMKCVKFEDKVKQQTLEKKKKRYTRART